MLLRYLESAPTLNERLLARQALDEETDHTAAMRTEDKFLQELETILSSTGEEKKSADGSGN
jgi:hypothetical protein